VNFLLVAEKEQVPDRGEAPKESSVKTHDPQEHKVPPKNGKEGDLRGHGQPHCGSTLSSIEGVGSELCLRKKETLGGSKNTDRERLCRSQEKNITD